MEAENPTSSGKPNRLARLKQAIKSVFIKPKPDVPVEKQLSPDEQLDLLLTKIRESWNEFVNKNLEFSDEDGKLLGAVTTYIYFTRNLFQRIGQYNGSIPARNHSILALTTNQATLLVEHVCSKLEERIVALNEKISARLFRQQHLVNTYQIWLNFQSDLTNYYQKHYQSFSWITAFLSIGIGSLLMIADVPLSLALVGNFDVGFDHSDGTIWDKLSDLELITFSLGVALSTIYIKILYDEYISNRLGTFSNLAIIPASPTSDPTTDSRQTKLLSPRAEFLVKLMVKLVILFLLVAMLVYLGLFRNMYSVFAQAETYTEGKITFPESQVVHVRLFSFILVTLVIPIISGVSLSTGFSIIHNITVRKRTDKKVDSLAQELKILFTEVEQLRAKKREFEVALADWNKQEHKIGLVANEFTGFYEQGYNEVFNKIYGNDLFKQVSVARNEMMRVALKSKLQAQMHQNHEN